MTAKEKTKPLATEEENDKAFLAAIQEVCDEHQRVLQPSPSWRFSQDGNDFRLVVNIGVGRLDRPE